MKIFAVNLTDIQKILASRKITDPRTKLPPQYHNFLKIFNRVKADILLPLRDNGMDHNIIFEKINKKKTQIS
jgi:hypothetical protein